MALPVVIANLAKKAATGALKRLASNNQPGVLNQILAGLSLTVVATLIILLPAMLIVGAFHEFVQRLSSFVPSFESSETVGDKVLDTSGGCPLPGGIIIRGALGGAYSYQHGTQEYWGMFPGQECSWPLPVKEAACYTTGNTQAASQCQINDNSCPEYGLAVDVAYPGIVSGPVYLPHTIEGESGLTWTSHGIAGPSTDHCGWNVFYRTTTSTGRVIEILYEHLGEEPAAQANSGEIISNSLANCNNNFHLHYELRIDGVYVNPEGLCSGDTGAPIVPTNIHGWLIQVNSPAQNVVGSLPSSEVGITTCDWAANHPEVIVAVNGSFGSNSIVPIGHTGYLGRFTNNPPTEGWETFDFLTYLINNTNTQQIITTSQTPNFPNPLPSNYRFAVTGVEYDNLYPASRPRTVIGTKGQSLYIAILRSATPQQAEGFMLKQGISNGFFLDGGGSTTLCRNGVQLFTGNNPLNPQAQARALSSHIGFIQAIISEF